MPHLENGWADRGSRLDLMREREKKKASPSYQHGIHAAYLWCQELEPRDTDPRVLAFHGREMADVSVSLTAI